MQIELIDATFVKTYFKLMRIESIKLNNYKTYKNIHIKHIPSFGVFVGANGTGKSTLFDIFSFLKDCLTHDVSKALTKRGGFHEVLSRGASGESILIELQCRMLIAEESRLVTYQLEIGLNNNKQACVKREILRYKRQSHGAPFHFLDFSMGEGFAISNEEDFSKEDKDLTREYQSLSRNNLLAIKGLGQFSQFKAASSLRSLIENWHISDFHINAARGTKEITGEYEHLSISGDNLQLVAKNLRDYHPDIFQQVIERMKECVPGVNQIETEETIDGRLLLKFCDGAFSDPFIDKFVSDGTIKMFAYLVLLHDPQPHPFLCIEEPENQLYPSLLASLADEFRDYAQRGGQVFVSSHSPDFLNATTIDEVFWLEKKNGFTKVNRANENEQLVAYMKEGDKMGYLWSHGLFGKVDPV